MPRAHKKGERANHEWEFRLEASFDKQKNSWGKEKIPRWGMGPTLVRSVDRKGNRAAWERGGEKGEGYLRERRNISQTKKKELLYTREIT